jgi:hypothetical protein
MAFKKKLRTDYIPRTLTRIPFRIFCLPVFSLKPYKIKYARLNFKS